MRTGFLRERYSGRCGRVLTLRVAVYLRVSTEDQARHGFSLAEQQAACEARAREMGASEVRVYADDGVTGDVLERPGLSALREAVRSGAVDVVLVRDADRLSRRLAHQLLLAEEFEAAGVRLEFLDFSWQDTPEGKLFFSIRSAVAEYEKEKIRDRMIRGHRQKARQGGIPIRFDVYGYRYDPVTGVVSVEESEAAVVREVFRMFVEEDRGPNSIAERLNAAGVRPPRGGRAWHKLTVGRMLRQTAYSGVWYYGRNECRDMGRNRPPGKRGRMRPRPREEWIPIPVPAIVDASLWARAQEKMARARQLYSGRKQRRFYLLSGLLVCSDCGRPMHGAVLSYWGTRERVYTCYVRMAGLRNQGCRPRKAVPADALEEAVWRTVCGWLTDPGRLLAALEQEAPGREALERELERVSSALRDVERGRENLVRALAAGVLELDAGVKSRLAELKRHRDSLLRRQEELRQALASPVPAVDLGQVSAVLRDPALVLLPEDKKALLRVLIREISVAGTRARAQVTVFPAFAAMPVPVALPVARRGAG